MEGKRERKGGKKVGKRGWGRQSINSMCVYVVIQLSAALPFGSTILSECKVNHISCSSVTFLSFTCLTQYTDLALYCGSTPRATCPGCDHCTDFPHGV